MLNLIVPIGHSRYKPERNCRRERSEIVHREKFEMTNYRSGEQVRDCLEFLGRQPKGAYPDARY